MEKDYNRIEKQIRARVIKAHMEKLGIKRCVCFTSGNASAFLMQESVETLSIGKGENFPLTPGVWWTPRAVAREFPEHFDATSGHLPLLLMGEIATHLRLTLGEDWEGGPVKIGSGETAVCLALAYPDRIAKIKLYRDDTPATEYSEHAQLNSLVRALYGSVEAPPQPQPSI